MIPTGTFLHLLIQNSFLLLVIAGADMIWWWVWGTRCLDWLLVYTLWKHPTLLPVLTTQPSVIPVLVRGADLMVPGGAQRMP